jgi:iron-sulfur cluster assembly protein
MITVSESAANRVKNFLQQKGTPEKKLRIRVISGGCSGLQYRFDFIDDSQIDKDDYQVDEQGIKVIIDPKSAIYLAGTQLDYYDTLMQSGFKMVNPNAKSTCSCGESFGV